MFHFSQFHSILATAMLAISLCVGAFREHDVHHSLVEAAKCVAKETKQHRKHPAGDGRRRSH